LEVTTLEGKTVHITSWTGGFYINNSTSLTKAGPQKGKSKKGGDKPFADASTASPPVNPLFQLKADKEEISEVESLSLETFYPNVTSSPPACVKSIEFSGWNPPPGNRNLLGGSFVVLVVVYF